MKKIYYLKSCTTCLRIIKSLELSDDFELQDLKENPLSSTDLTHLKTLAGSYEALFSRRAKRYKEMGLKNESLEERDYKRYILDHYTFLKRPVLVVEQQIFIGNNPKTIAAAKLALPHE
jgi:arsenate reductase